ncbi:MAG: ribonuclease H family protein [Lachnospiraceae bacterium]|nr:ribonuclease H family protein [Lachnospiraceae bacterium]
MASKYYAVKVGLAPGIYQSWAECEAQVKGYPGALFKSFASEAEAAAYLGVLEAQKDAAPAESDKDCVIAYVDGSYNAETNWYGYGVYLYTEDKAKEHIFIGNGECKFDGRNIEGEVAAAICALKKAKELGFKKVLLYHDYQGIGSWGNKEWKRNKEYTSEYADFVHGIRDSGIEVEFKHVHGHTGDEGNEIVDKLAKIGCSVSLTASEREFIERLKDVPGYPEELLQDAEDEIQIR